MRRALGRQLQILGFDVVVFQSGRHPPTILMSARDDRATRKIMRQVRPVAEIFKPFDEEILLRVIGKALRKGPNLLQ